MSAIIQQVITEIKNKDLVEKVLQDAIDSGKIDPNTKLGRKSLVTLAKLTDSNSGSVSLYDYPVIIRIHGPLSDAITERLQHSLSTNYPNYDRESFKQVKINIISKYCVEYQIPIGASVYGAERTKFQSLVKEQLDDHEIYFSWDKGRSFVPYRNS